MSDRDRQRPSEELRSRLLAAAAGQPATRPGTWRRRVLFCGMGAAAWMLAMSGLMGVRHDWHHLAPGAMAQTLVVLVAAAVAASAVGVSRGRAMVGASSEALLVLVTGLPLLLLVLLAAVDPRGAETVVIVGARATAVRACLCELLVLVVALPLLGLGWAVARGLTLARPALAGGCVGLAAATWAHAIVRLHCAVGGPGHALLGHLFPALPLILAGAYLFSRRGSADHSKRGKSGRLPMAQS